MRVFFDVFSAPEYVHTRQPDWLHHIVLKRNYGKFDGPVPVAYLKNSVVEFGWWNSVGPIVHMRRLD